MKTLVEGNTVTINDKLTITESDGRFLFGGNVQFGIGAQATPALEAKADSRYDRDPAYYDNGHNGLSVYDSAMRAATKLDRDFDEAGDQEGDFEDVYAACKALIERGEGRSACYRIGGAIVKAVRDSNLYRGLPLAFVFRGYVKGKFAAPEDVTVSSSYRAVQRPYFSR